MTTPYVGQVSYNVKYPIFNQTSYVSSNNVRTDSVKKVVQNDSFAKNSNETCTDGKDDGKIGFFSAAWNAIKGVGKTAVNMVKGCFTGSDGKFSIKRTLITAATAAACIAFPAVGLVACGIGAVAGAVQIGKGVYNAVTAKTDAEAKLAWQDVGGGALTTGLSIAGAKASYGAVMKTSTAGINGGSATSELAKDASIMSKARALGKDMWSSTANKAEIIKETASISFTKAKNTYKNSDYAQAKELLKEAKKSGNAEDVTAGKQLVRETVHNYMKEAKNNVKSSFRKAKNNVKRSKETITEGFDKISKLDTASAKYLKVKSNVANLLETKGISTDKPISNIMTQLKKTNPELFIEYGYRNVLQVVQSIIGNRAVDQAI